MRTKIHDYHGIEIFEKNNLFFMRYDCWTTSRFGSVLALRHSLRVSAPPSCYAELKG
jgi:hypothetical protein